MQRRVQGDESARQTDSPPLFVLKEEGVDLINRIGLSDEEKDKVYYRNAKQLLKL